jgi:hypothetical protein
MIEITSIKVGVYRFLGKANMGWCSAHVRFWHKADIRRPDLLWRTTPLAMWYAVILGRGAL